MIVLIDTSTKVCRLTLIDSSQKYQLNWEADRTLARDLLKFIKTSLEKYNKQFSDIKAIGVFTGPGSFTGLRIGMTVVNTLSNELKIPIVGANGSDWQDQAQKRLNNGDNDKIVLPQYGSEANVTKPRK